MNENMNFTYRLNIDNDQCVFRLDTFYTRQMKITVITDGVRQVDSRPIRTCIDRLWHFLAQDLAFRDCDSILLDDETGISQIFAGDKQGHLVIKPMYSGNEREQLVWSAIRSLPRVDANE
ncbi:hypothetical protein [Vibrio agarivorans]|uniref:hypothetical protein n=1 Tax=Vibrio agarivorans TaxID=153622 RepID=UPI0025B28DA4|nr:hypothetical protein [Vibrio agarivorans]MDN3661144.1 hypothetical protein [Vibrio agarivorans]